MKIDKWLHMWLRKKFNVYIVFVTTTISTWVNDKLHEPTWNTFDQPPCLMIWRSFNAWFMSRIQVNLPNNKHFEGLSREGMSGGGGGVLNHYAFPFPPYSATQLFLCWSSRNMMTQKRVDYLLPTSPLVLFKYCFSFQTKPDPWIEFRKNLSKCITDEEPLILIIY